MNIKMRKIRQINIKNQTYYFYNNQIDLKDFDAKFFEEKNENKYLVLDEIAENKEVLNKYKDVWEGIKK